ncbi:hypothetical protein [Nannocystis radixulma]|uniref:Lipoprotein n=1 Tax=Nannocystis radixulma TaxID=2995305 RepID=A0ABT5BJK4_9BACT|nr:hypothetical protein [Nannocystis radixulma]MDC0674336.1 hypothetical protein [Nannocystis radixulma]
MIANLSTYLMPRLSAGALFAFSAATLVACGDDGSDSTASETDTDSETGTDTIDPTATTGPGTTSTTDPTTTGVPTTTDDGTVTDPTSPTTTTTTATDTDAITSTTTTGTDTGPDTTTGDTTTGDTTTGDTTTEGDTSTSTSTGVDTDTSSTGDTDTGGPVKPDDCVDLSLADVELLSQQQHQFDSAWMVPLVRSPESLASLTGDEALSDLLRILFSGDITVGVHALDPDPNHAFPDYVTNFVTTSNAAVTLQEDLVDQAYTKVFTAVAGELEIFELVSSHQTRGVVRHVELREMAPNPDTEALEPVEGGACYWIAEAEYDVRRVNGCTPYTDDACPEGQFCMPTNAIGSDGECVTGGTKLEGEACVRPDPELWDSDCELGLRCLNPGDGPTCMKVCDVLSDAPGCAEGTHCGGGYNLCLDEAELQNSGIDPAPVGEPCADNPEALYCGGAGRPGTCWDDDGNGPMPSSCRPFVSAPSQCVAPQTAGHIAYKDTIDRSTLWCFELP